MVDDCSALLYTIPVGGALRDTGVRLRSHKLETNVPSIKEQRRVSYVPLENAAQRLQVTVDELLDFHTRGWIYVIHGEEARFLHGCDEYKARFILHLRRSRGLEDHEISTVLLAQEPPYSLDAVDEILAKAGTSGGPSRTPVTARSRKLCAAGLRRASAPTVAGRSSQMQGRTFAQYDFVHFRG